jgi:hypothetical protein
MHLLLRQACLVACLALAGTASAQVSPARVTILYDAIGKSPALEQGWRTAMATRSTTARSSVQ